MFKPAPLADTAGAVLFEKTERRLEALLAEHGASDPSELPVALQSRLLQSAIIETAAANFPAANLEMMKHGFRSFTHSAFLPAMDRMNVSCKSPGDAFETTRGIHAAVVLAGYGLTVAPFDLEATHILAKPSNDIDTVQALFSADKGAYVGYSTCDAPFYLLLTDCVRSLRQLVPVHPRLSEVKQLFARTGQTLPSDFGQTFMPGMAVIAQQRGDTIWTVGLLDPDPAGGSIMLYAGWEVEGELFGPPNEGYLPVPGQLLRRWSKTQLSPSRLACCLYSDHDPLKEVAEGYFALSRCPCAAGRRAEDFGVSRLRRYPPGPLRLVPYPMDSSRGADDGSYFGPSKLQRSMKASRAARFAPGLGPVKQRCFSNEEGNRSDTNHPAGLRVMWVAEKGP